MSKEKKFEESFSRLEEILKELNENEVSLDQSLKLYEEANQLILNCHKRLSNAESKVSKLIKERDGELATNSDGQPLTEDY